MTAYIMWGLVSVVFGLGILTCLVGIAVVIWDVWHGRYFGPRGGRK